MRIIFMGTPDFSVPALRNITKTHKVIAVYTQPPRPKGRGHQVQKSPVHLAAEEYGIPVRTPASFKKDPAALAEFLALEADVAVVAAYGLILPKAVLEHPQYGCLNIHASLLPRWRGASPIQRAIWAGDTETGVTIMQMDEGLDTGPMILKKAVPVTAETTAQTLHDTLSAIGSDLILEALSTLEKTGALKSEKQDDAHTTYAPLLKKEDGVIDWTQTPEAIHRQVRALNPWPGTSSTLNGQRFKILAGEIKDGLYQVTRLQPEGGKPMDIKSAINGGYLKASDRFGP